MLRWINVKNAQSSIRCWDSNPRPSEHDQGSLPHETKFRVKKFCSIGRRPLFFVLLYFLSFIHWFPSQDFPLFIWLLLDIALSLYSFASLLSFSVTKLGYFWRVFGIIFLTVVSRCGSVGKAVTYNTRDPRFISSHQQFLFTINCNKKCIEKSIIKKMRQGIAPF